MRDMQICRQRYKWTLVASRQWGPKKQWKETLSLTQVYRDLGYDATQVRKGLADMQTEAQVDPSSLASVGTQEARERDP